MNTRHVFNDDFYKVTALLLSKKFLAIEVTVRNKYLEAGLPIPARGFKEEKLYREWLSKARSLTETPGKHIEDILVSFKIDPKNEYYRNALTARLFFNKMPWEDSQYIQNPIELIIRKGQKSKEIWVKIHPWTKKSDYMNLWQSIKDVQQTLPEYRPKEKFQITFERNFAVYQLYLKAKKDIEASSEKVSIEEKMTTYPEYASIAKQFNGGDFFDNLRSITSDLNKRLKGITIL